MTGYAVIDVETTGLAFDGHDRIIELGIVLTDEHGRVESEFETLLNPHRDLGVQSIHRISARDAAAAPDFREVVGQLTDVIWDRVVVAHNLRFEVGFLVGEYARIDVRTALDYWSGVCTMYFGGKLLKPKTKSLSDCCAAAGVVYPADAHAAIADARVTAELLRKLIELQGGPQHVAWADRFGRVERAAADGAWEDVPVGATPLRKRGPDFMPRFSSHEIAARPGTPFAFTGGTDHGVWLRAVQEFGYAFDPFVTSSTGYLVAADIDTQSAKARRAHKLGVPVISEVELAEFLDIEDRFDSWQRNPLQHRSGPAAA